MTKLFRYTATIEIEADDQNQANHIIDLIKKEGQFPDGTIVENNFNITSWESSK